ncbi:hypothetical protein [Streptomyces sp. TLI_185]|uniref:hypothetical protein n=1 Tax=Streptomyces sp. TLI_185 TaxID=2485151 RepID=UPI000F4E05F2|nr:hypothetical protein [Streptomyces sp. TLI_185]
MRRAEAASPNGYEYGASDYKDQGPDAALALLTKNVEDLCNEQRRRQQQLDQPTEQASPTAGASPA